MACLSPVHEYPFVLHQRLPFDEFLVLGPIAETLDHYKKEDTYVDRSTFNPACQGIVDHSCDDANCGANSKDEQNPFIESIAQ